MVVCSTYCWKKKRKEEWSIRLVLKQLIKFLLTVDNQLRFPSNNGLNALSVYKRNDFFCKAFEWVSSLEEKEETFQEEANVSRQFIISYATDHGRPERKSTSLNGRKSTPTPKFLGTDSTARAYFVCHINPNFQISLIYAIIGYP